MTFDKYRDDRPTIYVSGPMTAENGWLWELNIRRGEEIGFKLVDLGAAVIIPQSHGRFTQGLYDRQTWMEVDLALLKNCQAMVTVPGWERSTGAKDEFAYANDRGIPVMHLPPMPWSDPVLKEVVEWIESLRGGS